MIKGRNGYYVEPRWPVALSILVVLAVLVLMTGRVRLFPFWFPYVIVAALLLPMAGVRLSNADARWRGVERTISLVFPAVVETVVIMTLVYLIFLVLNHTMALGGRQLLASSIGTWITNVLAFSIVYWQMDRGGPEARANNDGSRPDWLFPQAGVPELAPDGWRPMYADYLFLAFSTASAFSTTDVAPLTMRAKMLMMFESIVSLITLVIVAARAINILSG
jgi:uncharacterized membrane protein